MFATVAKSTCDGLIVHESTIKIVVYVDMLENFVFPQIAAEVNGLNFQQDDAPAHFGAIVRTALDDFLVHGSVGEGPLFGSQ
jgi:hypothetical protein